MKILAKSITEESLKDTSVNDNLGAILFQDKFLSADQINEAAALANALSIEKRAVHQAGRYSDLKWFQCEIDHDWPIARQILDELGAENPEMMVFYYLEPGAKIHPHRDLSGAALSNRIRFHVPIITNSNVCFMVDNQRVTMKPGQLWCLDTSYLHSVANDGTHSRVHIVVECSINDKLKIKLPNNLKTKLHTLNFILIMSTLFVKSLIVNIFKDPRYLWNQIKMIFRYFGWRFLGIGRPR